MSQWVVIFERRAKRNGTIISPSVASAITSVSKLSALEPAINPQNLERELIKRGIGPAFAEELSLSQPSSRVREMLELDDWYNNRGQPRGPGFLVQSIRNPTAIALPPSFESFVQRQESQQARETQKRAEANVSIQRERILGIPDSERLRHSGRPCRQRTGRL